MVSKVLKPTFGRWDDVPDSLATKTQLGRMGLKPARGQRAVAYKRRVQGSGNDYKLYEIEQAVPKRKMSPAQEAALAKARQAAVSAREAERTCAECGEVFGRPEWLNGDGLCQGCADAAAREAAVFWAQHVLAEETAVFLDTETTGLDKEAEVIQIGMVNVAGDVVMNTLVRPSRRMGPDAIGVHGITNEHVAVAPDIDDIYEALMTHLEAASLLVIYNAAYDVRVLRHTVTSRCLAWPDWVTRKATCAMERYRAWLGERRNVALPGGDHSAVGDARATLALVKKMAGMENGGWVNERI